MLVSAAVAGGVGPHSAGLPPNSVVFKQRLTVNSMLPATSTHGIPLLHLFVAFSCGLDCMPLWPGLYVNMQ